MKKLLWAVLISGLTFSAAPAFADQLSKVPAPPTRFQTYLKNTDTKFDRGAINFAGGWTEFIRQPLENYKNPGSKNRWAYTAQGAGVGLVTGVVDMVGGFLNAATALIPHWEIPLPQDGVKAENITGGNAEVFPDEEITESYSSSSPQKAYTNL